MRNFIIVSVACWGFVLVTSITFGTFIEEQRSEMKSHLGQQVVIGNETFVIVDYNIIRSSYTMSNGLVLSRDFVEQNIK